MEPEPVRAEESQPVEGLDCWEGARISPGQGLEKQSDVDGLGCWKFSGLTF